MSILLKALCQCGQEGEAVKYHQKSLELLYAPKSFVPASSTESWSSSSIGRVKKFLNSVTHGFVQHLASEHRVEDVIGVLDGVHASIEHFSSLHAQHTGTAAVSGNICNYRLTNSNPLFPLTSSTTALYCTFLYPSNRLEVPQHE